jgi:pimeloyl-ACP methyl ester carboxylesterase
LTDLASLLSELRKRKVSLRLVGDQLKCVGPVGVLDAPLLQVIASQKNEIISSLRRAEAYKTLPRTMIPLNLKGSRAPLFFLSGDRENIFYTRSLMRYLKEDRPVLVVHPPGYDGRETLNTVQALAHHQLEQIRSYRPNGPYLLAGHCMGGIIAFEAARQLSAAGERVALLANIAGRFPSTIWPTPSRLCRVVHYIDGVSLGPLCQRQQFIKEKFRHHFGKTKATAKPNDPGPQSANDTVLAGSFEAIRSYRPGSYNGPIDLCYTSGDWVDFLKWRKTASNIRWHRFDFNVHELRHRSNVKVLVESMQARLDASD